MEWGSNTRKSELKKEKKWKKKNLKQTSDIKMKFNPQKGREGRKNGEVIIEQF